MPVNALIYASDFFVDAAMSRETSDAVGHMTVHLSHNHHDALRTGDALRELIISSHARSVPGQH